MIRICGSYGQSIICKYSPNKKSRIDDLLHFVKLHSKTEPNILTFYRFEPQKFESEFKFIVNDIIKNKIEEIVIDISVMSKLMIMIIICSLENFEGTVRIIYYEPIGYAPTQDEYNAARGCVERLHNLPSLGVHDVVRT